MTETAGVRNDDTNTSDLPPENPIDHLEREIPALRRFARALVGIPEKADDLVQDTLERAITRIDSFTPGTNMRAWLFTILRNNHINDLRRARSVATAPEVVDGMLPPSRAGQDQGLAVRDLRRALDRLTPEMREVVILVGLEGMSYEQAADVIGVKVGTVKSRLCRGRESLRRLLEDGSLPADLAGVQMAILTVSAAALLALLWRGRRIGRGTGALLVATSTSSIPSSPVPSSARAARRLSTLSAPTNGVSTAETRSGAPRAWAK